MRPPIRVAIVDDEPLARAALRLSLAVDPELVVVGDCNGVDAPQLIEREQVELVFLDVQMPEVDGFAVLEALDPGALPAIVFVTAHDAYAVRAFEVHAIDYLLKPFDDARLATALARAKERLARPGEAGEQLVALLEERARRERQVERLLVRARGKVVAVRTQDIDWIEAADYYATLHVGGATHLVRQTMAELETSLDGRRFVRVHRRAIVNIDRVREVHPMFRGDCTLVLADGTRIRLSRTRRAEFERMFGTPR
ncbi:MAG TPA: LytTR family DNA-binding domain-containing protein [Kofleriaceae bacterium]